MHFFYVLFLWSAMTLSAQEFKYTIPETVQKFIDQGSECLKNKGERCLDFYEQAIEEARRIDTDSLEAITYYDIGDQLYHFGNVQDLIHYTSRGTQLDGNKHPYTTHRLYRDLGYGYSRLTLVDSLFPVYEQAFYWAEVARDTAGMAMANIRMASAYRMKSDYTKSIEILLDTRPLVQATGDVHRESGILFSLGNAYLGNDDLDQAMEKFDEAAKGFIKAEDSSMYASAVVNWAIAANANNEQDAVLVRLPDLVGFFEKNEPSGTIYVQTQLARAYTKNKAYEKAIPLYEKTIAQAAAQNNEYIRKINIKQLAQLYVDQKQGAKALPLAQEIYDIESARGVSESYLSTLHLFADALSQADQNKEAIPVYQEYIRVKDSLFNLQKEKEIAGMREQFEADRREAQIELLEKDKEVSGLQKTLLGVGLIAVLGLLIAGWIRFRESKKRAILERDKLDAEIHYKNKELTTHTLHLAKKNEILAELKDKVSQLQGGYDTRAIINKINFDLKDEENWEHFTQYFEKVHTDFTKTVLKQFPNITPNELRLMALLKMNLTSKEIANMLNITADGVKKARQRLRKKMELTPEDSLEALVTSF